MTMPTDSLNSPSTNEATDPADDVAEANEIKRLRDLAGPPPWAASIADQLSTIVGLLEGLQTASADQTRQIASLVATVGQVQELGSALPPDMLANIGKMFGS